MYIIRQKEALCQGLNNAAPFTFLPHPHTSSCRKWLAVQQKFRLPRLHGLREGCYAWPNLSLRLMDDNASSWSGRSPSCCFSQIRRHLLGNPLPLLDSSGLRRRCLSLALRGWLLRGLPHAGHEAVYGHGLPGRHIFAEEGLGV